MNGTTRLTHYRYIDALRGIAFLGVLTVHVSQQIPSLPGAGTLSAGMYGVQLFFLLSALTLLRSASLRTSQENHPLRNFLIRRLFRIAPLFWFGIALYLLLVGIGPRYWSPDGVSPWHVAATALFLHGWTPATINSVVPGGWSISVEMTFYACLPFLARRVTTLWAAVTWAFSALLASLVLAQLFQPLLLRLLPAAEQPLVGEFLTLWFPAQLPIFLLGFAVYHALHHAAVTRFLARPRRPAFLALLALLALAALARSNSGLIPIQIGYALAFSMGILALAAHPFRLVVNPLTCHLGVLSFSCYVTHFAAIACVGHFLNPAAFASLPASLAACARFGILWTAALALTALVSTFTYFLIEKPGMQLGRLLIRRDEIQRISLPVIDAAS